MTTVYVIDDEVAVRDAMSLLLRLAGYGVETHVSGESFLVGELDGHGCILLDMKLGGIDGLVVLEALAARGNRLPVILLTAHGDIPLAVRAMRAGAADVIPKSTAPEDLLARIAELLRTGSAERRAEREARALRLQLASLTPRESEILALAAAGHETRETALRLGISPRTVEVHRSNVARKCGVASVADLFRLAAMHGVALPRAP